MREEHWNGNRTVNITGHALAPPIQVWFGSVPADNRTLQMLSRKRNNGFRIAVPAQTAGLTSLFVHTLYGNADNAWTFSYFNNLVVTSITSTSRTAATGSAAGGTLVVLTGVGFSPTLARNVVTFGSISSGSKAVVVQSNYTYLVVQVVVGLTSITIISISFHPHNSITPITPASFQKHT